tara:strand:+ start:229 stop:534 length:306 start_codon:yes stop_codon:yes gene_type:complete
MKATITRIKKVKALKKVPLNDVQNEISDIVLRLQDENPDVAKSFCPHVVSLGRERYVACDAKYLNRQANQSGRGDYRYLFQDNAYAGLAEHQNRGGYRMVA